MANNTSAKRPQFVPRVRTSINEPRSSRRLSVTLFGIGIITTLAVASWMGFLNKSNENKLEIKDITISDNGNVELTGARYQGVTSDGQPFQITANQATEALGGSGRVDMTQPRAKVTLRNGQVLDIKSNFGIFEKQAESVDMSGSVVVLHPSKSLTLTSEALFADLKIGKMYSNSPVVVEDNNTRIDAETMTVFDNGDRILFEGTARLVIQKHSNPNTTTN
jgi:lipopolysaccharide export system protein LptC